MSQEITTRAVQIAAHGGADVMVLWPLPLAEPGPGEVRVRHTAIGVNYIDVYDRSGLYPSQLPAVLGREAAGVVEALGPGVTEVALGDRVAYALATPGAYTERRNVPAERLVPIPEGVADATAAAALLKGLTAQFLLRRTYPVRAGEWIVVHAAAGGVGQILCQWARLLGAKVIGVVGHENKVAAARKAGCAHVIVRQDAPIAPQVRELTGGGCAVVYDSAGQATFLDSLDCLRPLGMMVTYGNASGPVAPIAPLELTKRGSLFLTRPQLFAYIARREELLAMASELFEHIAAGRIEIGIGLTLSLASAATAHRALESRDTQGAIVLLPDTVT